MFHFLSVLTFLLQMLVVIFIACIASVVIAQQTPNVAQAVSLPFQASGLNIEDVPFSTNNEENWFRFQATVGDTITVSLTFSHASGDIDSRMYRSCGSTTASCTGKMLAVISNVALKSNNRSVSHRTELHQQRELCSQHSDHRNLLGASLSWP